jgi:cyclic 2,3-diphosphoglycerate synthetase
VVDALEQLGERYRFVGAVFLGGSEKVRTGELETEAEGVYGLPVLFGEPAEAVMHRAIDIWSPEVVVDLSDEPVLGYRERFRLVSHSLARNVAYHGSDFSFTPPRLEPFTSSPSLSIIGTGKRVGKTAVSGYIARLLQDSPATTDDNGLVVVAMGRGGPREPEVVDGRTSQMGPDDLLELSRGGRHAASDHIEDAVLSRVLTVGCRRCGGGMAGQVLVSNVLEGAALAGELGAGFTIFEGSGAAFPPVRTGARLLVAGAHQELEQVAGYLGMYRVLVSDAVVLTMAEPPSASADQVGRMVQAVKEIRPQAEVIPVVFRPRPVEEVSGSRVAVFTTAANVDRQAAVRYLEQHFGCEVVFYSAGLSSRPVLREELAGAEVARADVFLTEIKAAAVDVVVEEANRRGLRTVFLDNEPVEVRPAEQGDLARVAGGLAQLARQRFKEQTA